jgi:hypothetical protein
MWKPADELRIVLESMNSDAKLAAQGSGHVNGRWPALRALHDRI